MFICLTRLSSVIGFVYSGQQVFSYTCNAHWTFCLLKQWGNEQVQKLMLLVYLFYSFLGLCGLILFSDLKK
jgi:hypothetical protein